MSLRILISDEIILEDNQSCDELIVHNPKLIIPRGFKVYDNISLRLDGLMIDIHMEESIMVFIRGASIPEMILAHMPGMSLQDVLSVNALSVHEIGRRTIIEARSGYGEITLKILNPE